MTNAAWTPQEETALAEYLASRVCDRALGRSENECLRNAPRDVYFIGNLRPRPEDGDLGELINKLAPMAFGAEFRFQPESNEVTVKVKVQWSCYYRVFPTFSQQRKHQQQIVETENDAESSDANSTASITTSGSTVQQLANTSEEPDGADHTLEIEQEQEEQRAEAESPEVVQSSRDRRSGRVPQDSLAIRYRKILCSAMGEVVLRRDVTGDWSRDVSNLKTALDQETTRAQQVTLGDSDRVRTAGSADDKIRVREDALASKADYEAFLRSLQTDVVPVWRWEIASEVRPNDELGSTDQVVAIEFVNASPQADNPNVEAFLFDSRTTFIFADATVQPFELELAPRGFRYNRDLWGRGFNCAVERLSGQVNAFETTHAPIYRQMRYVTQTNPPARFADLASNPIPVLRAIVNEMGNYRQRWQEERQNYIATSPDWETEFGSEFDRDFQQYEDEIRRFRRGCELIRTNPDVELAFRLTNETFRRLGAHPRPEKRKESWRLFQIVFLISQIPGMAALADPNSPDAAEREMVDIIYFPTGGGKTEAYLGTIVFHCFFDRLRGKTAGVTAWTRFPLRLLTLQQTQRMADAIGIADLVRREQPDPRLSSRDIDKFAVGYFVGAEATPNELVNSAASRYPDPKHSVSWSIANDANHRQKWKRVISCPSCHTSTVQVDFDPNSVRIIHRCTQPSCAFPNGEIPIYVIDNEIYRYLPCVMVGTIDKLASLGNQRKLSQVFGQIDGRCTQHGYYKGKCCQKDCSGGQLLRPGRPRGLAGPTLFVQDELHLLKEGLGTFDGHYETFTQQLQQEFDSNSPSLKVIASSATIEAFERQVEHLYGRRRNQARIFPGLGSNLQESFYAQTRNYPSRLFVGILPHNKTIFNTILELIEFYHRETHYLKHLSVGAANPYGGILNPGSPEWHQLMDFYITSLTYFRANRELDSIRVDLDGDVNPNLQPDGLELEISQLTGGTSTDEVTRILEKLEQSATSSSTADTVLATSMISHGVDVDRFNGMIFYGMPSQNAEYIQASSRVGRSHVGIVFNCLHPARERDQSHYTYFVKFHEFLGQLVEPVAINRWAKFSVNRTLPGLFMGVLLQLISNRSGINNPNSYYMLDFVKREISNGNLDINQFIPILERAYLVQSAGPANEQAFQAQIRLQVQQFLDQIISAGSGEKFISGVLIPQPMTSLRDVDEPIPIELDSNGTQWAARS